MHEPHQQARYDRRSGKDRRRLDDNIMPPDRRSGGDRRKGQIGTYVRNAEVPAPDSDHD